MHSTPSRLGLIGLSVTEECHSPADAASVEGYLAPANPGSGSDCWVGFSPCYVHMQMHTFIEEAFLGG